MPQDAFTLNHVCRELNDMLAGGKISRVNQPSRDIVTFIIYTQKDSVKLDICLSAQNNGLIIAENERSNPSVAPNFCMLLRKHLQNAEIKGIGQIGAERVIYIDLNCFSEFEQTDMRLYLEIMGKYSNAILTKDGIVVRALKTAALSDDVKRALFTGLAYRLPEPQDKAEPNDLNAIKTSLQNMSGDEAKWISEKIKGVAYSTAADIVEFYGEGVTAEQVYEYLNGEYSRPCVIYRGGEPVDFAVRSQQGGIKLYGSVLEAQSAYYGYVTTKKSFEDKKRKLLGALSSSLKKCEKHRANIFDKRGECAAAETVKLKGELITANIYAIERGMTKFEAVNYYDEKGGKISIDLDARLTPSQNAQKYYKRYAKLKRTQENLDILERENEEKLNYLTSIKSSICAADSILDLVETEEELKSLGLIKSESEKKKRKPPESPFRQYELNGFKILCGCNNLQNDRLLKSLSGEDLWLHAQKYHSAHAAVIAEGRRVPDEILLAAAQICAYYSDGREAGKVPVDYTKRKFVKKPPKSAAGFVIYTEYKTILVEPNAKKEIRQDEKTKK